MAWARQAGWIRVRFEPSGQRGLSCEPRDRMTRRTFLAALAGLPFVGELFAGAAPEFAPGVVEEAFVASNPIYFVGGNGWWRSGGGDGVLRWFDTIHDAVKAAPQSGATIVIAENHIECFQGTANVKFIKERRP